MGLVRTMGLRGRTGRQRVYEVQRHAVLVTGKFYIAHNQYRRRNTPGGEPRRIEISKRVPTRYFFRPEQGYYHHRMNTHVPPVAGQRQTFTVNSSDMAVFSSLFNGSDQSTIKVRDFDRAMTRLGFGIDTGDGSRKEYIPPVTVVGRIPGRRSPFTLHRRKKMEGAYIGWVADTLTDLYGWDKETFRLR